LAKFQRLGPVWRKPKPKPWKQLKACTSRANLFQFVREFDPNASSAIEITTANGQYAFITEQSNAATPEYIQTEGS